MAILSTALLEPKLKSEIESGIEARLRAKLGAPVFSYRPRPEPEWISTGIAEIDVECGGLHRGAINEIAGPASSGRTTLLYSILAGATVRGEACALIDASDAFDPCSGAAAGIDFGRLLWVRCAASESHAGRYSTRDNHAMRVADLLLASGGWGVIALDLGDIDPRDAQRIPLNVWHRFRLAVENKPTVFVVLGREPYATSCSALVLETAPARAQWKGLFLRGAVFEVRRRKPAGRTARFEGSSLELPATTNSRFGFAAGR